MSFALCSQSSKLTCCFATSLSELLYVPMPELKTASQKSESILIGANTGISVSGGDADSVTGGKWEDEEERRFFEEIPDLKDYVPRSVLGLEGDSDDAIEADNKEKEKERMQEEVRKLEEELTELKVGEDGRANGDAATTQGETYADPDEGEDEDE